MAYRLTRARLYRTLAGAASALVLSGIAIFAAAHHFAVRTKNPAGGSQRGSL
jgi:hypothetical protein